MSTFIPLAGGRMACLAFPFSAFCQLIESATLLKAARRQRFPDQPWQCLAVSLGSEDGR